MKKANAIMFGILATTIALSALIAPVAAVKYVHPRGIMMTTYPPQLLVYAGAPGEYTVGLAVVMYAPYYFVQDQTSFDSVTLKMQLMANCPSCRTRGEPATLAGAANGVVTVKWSTLTISQEMNGAFLQTEVTFVITGNTGSGYYMLYLSAEADSSSLTFYGWDQIPVAVSSWYL